MKMQSQLTNNLFQKLSKIEMETLTIEVKETLFKKEANKKFSAAELWNIQKNKRMFRGRKLYA